MEENNHQEVFKEAFDLYADAIFRFCLVKTSNKEQAEDLTQETFSRFWQSLRSGREMRNTKAFLYTIANNLVIDWYRKHKSVSLDVLEDAGFEARDSNIVSTAREAEYGEIFRALEELDADDREIVVMRFVDELEPREIAEILGITANATSVRINRAIERMRKITNPEERPI